MKGFKPMLADDARLWSAARQSVRRESIVLVGSSRMHADVHPAFFDEVVGERPVQLAVNGGFSYLVLEQLARDSKFRGTVICELTEVEIATGRTTELEKGYINSYQPATLAQQSESFLKHLAQKHLTFASPQLSLPALINYALHGQRPQPSTHYHIAEDRALLVDFTSLDIEKLRSLTTAASYQGPDLSPAEFVAQSRRFEELANEIERRGGRVFFVRLPVTGVLWDRLEKAYPKKSYWDEFARHSHSQTIHFKDYPELQVECPDYSHLDMKDSPGFTRALAKVLLEKGWVRSR
jgi:hypothetical protein